MARQLTQQDQPFLEALSGDLEARNKIVVDYLPLGLKIAYRLNWIGDDSWVQYSREEAISLIAQALMAALRTYDPTKASFAKHASRRIRMRLKREKLVFNGFTSSTGGAYDVAPPSLKPLIMTDVNGELWEPEIDCAYAGLQERRNYYCPCGKPVKCEETGRRGSNGLCETCYTRSRRNGVCGCGWALFSYNKKAYCKNPDCLHDPLD